MPISPRLIPALWLGFAFVAGCRPAPEAGAPAASAVSVRVAPIELSTASPAVEAAGELARLTEASLAFPVAGIVDGVAVRTGDRVARGQELARLKLDPTDALASQAAAALEKARRDLGRIERLQAERVATLENLQDARTAVANAEAAVRLAEFNRDHAVLKAPADGTILRRLAEPNELVAAGQPVLAFAGEGEGWLARAGLAARDAARLAVGAAATIDDGAGGTATGHVVRIAAAADPATRTVPVEVQLDRPTAAARSGLIVSLVITPPPVPARTAIPLAAIRDGQGGRAFVFLLAPGADTVRRTAVEIEEVDGDRAYLRTPLPADHRVVVAGAQFVADGGKVRIAD
jgi:multidrug efflux system membrane fusion protein